MHVKIVLQLACVTAYFEGQGFSTISPVDRGQLVKNTHEPHGIFGLKRHTYTFNIHDPATCMQNYDETLPTISLAGRCLLVKMLITL